MTIEQAQIADHFQTLLDAERNAAAMYGNLAATASDPQARMQFEQLCRDKQRHVRLAERLLEIVE